MKLTVLEQKVVDYVDELANELVQFCQDLIRIPSWDRDSRGEAEVAHRVGTTLEMHGINPDYFASHPSIDNLVATMDSKKGKKRLLLNGHSDVVPPGADWTVAPFAAEVQNGRIYGRGAMDMKGGIAAMTMAMCALQDLAIPLAGTLILNVVGDEERQGVLGTAWCIEKIWKKIHANAAIIPEPTGLDPLSKTVCIGEKGPVWVNITTIGEKAHGSIPSAGKNAITVMLRLLQALIDTKPPTIPPPISRKALNEQFARALGTEVKQLEILTTKSNEANLLLSCLDATTTTTMNIGTINGGVMPNVVPDRCEAQLDFRILPGQKPQEMIDFILATSKRLGINAKVGVKVIEACEGNSIPNFNEDAIVRAVFDVSRVLVGPTTYFMVPYATDGRLLRKAGITSTVVFGPGNMALAHTADENVAIDDLIKVTKALAISAIRYLGTK